MLAGCSVLPEESEPIEASAPAPAVLPGSSEYSLVVEESPTVETTVTVDFSGDVELTSRQDIVALATDTDVGALSEWSADGSAILLGTETTQMAATATLSGSEQALAHVRVRAGEDSVTAVATDPDDAAPPFGAVTRDA